MFISFLDYSALIINVLYTIYLARLKIWSWSLGIVGAVLLLILFAIKGTYSLVLLQCVYVIFFSYGWYKWHTQGIDKGDQVIRWMKAKDYIRYICYIIMLCALGVGFNYITGSKDILSTGLLTGITFVAVIMTIEKFMENWIIWIVSDLYFVVVMYQQGLHGQTIQNFIFFLTAVYGFYYWHKHSSKVK
ncbi:nicotinamide riboside transporter PnuC [Francisella adeliensis]|uniref:Nicotinamide riboside transporter PnuC n=1 Tax=Francisella adeliensis TaxID=2007306 RepID=A0A2Z4Y1C9_9GAMM|nr:nicotinamide riboside transporter PnuC [Francisella adeliensis]AXA34503.1 nicotinamide ribonucleoside (NR) uptake permease (PnuC) family protein [Francisella adeliensis]MBK2086223.1 nicotinamide mononucleotide transporter [Francisella adeliensis]MBK2096440.1 nicotinamide mononucleotide transporter [Francisella adeliensis]QIW12750.1 nicotinamide mononucleotide transporter [Francisella adeliensis]QIW14627.1 nicotinamide mononucleotide transporter [Francisella adeliensis]